MRQARHGERLAHQASGGQRAITKATARTAEAYGEAMLELRQKKLASMLDNGTK